MPRADALCPQGFAPHAVRPSRCKRCFRDYNEHKTQDDAKVTKKDEDTKPQTTKKRDSLTESQLFGAKRDAKADSAAKGKEKTAVEENKTKSTGSEAKGEAAWANYASETSAEATIRLRRRRSEAEKDEEEKNEESSTSRTRTRVRPNSTGDEPKGKESRSRSPSPSSQRRNSESLTDAENLQEERRSRTRIQILSAHEVRPDILHGMQSDEDTSADVAFILQVKTASRPKVLGDGDDDDTMSQAFTETTDTTIICGESLEDLQLQMQTLRNQLDVTEDRCSKLEQERKELQTRVKEMDQSNRELDNATKDLQKLRSKVHELETLNEDLRDENKVVKLEIKEIQDEVERRVPQTEVQKTIDELRTKLTAAETLCEELMEENEDIKREIHDLEDEIEEMQDNFREDQADEYSILRKELEQTAKNCRILQFKLRKAEKRCDQLDTDKSQYEDQLKVLIKGGHLDMLQVEKLRQMELELSTARDVSVRMHSDMESLQSKLRHLQDEKETLAKKITTENGESNKNSTKKDGPEIHPVSKDAPQEMDSSQLLRDLYDTVERENDLKEQLRFTEEEAENLRKKLSFLEQENETLVLQIKKMASAKKSKDGRRPPSRESSRDDDSGISDDTDELSPSELRLQLELFEQEADVLRRKVTELDGVNVGLQKEVKELQEKLAEKPKFQMPSHQPSNPAQANIFFEQKIQVLESEAKELRMKLIDKERENERMSSELSLKQRKGSRTTMMTRSRSLDSDTQVDLKKQLQLVEQEAAILRQRTADMENENDKLVAENSRLQVKTIRKGSLTPQEQLAAENMCLKDKMSKLQKKLTDQESAPLPVSAEDGLALTSLQDEVKKKDEEVSTLTKKVDNLYKDNQKLNEQIKTLKAKTNVQIKKRKKIPDAAPKSEFKKAVEELEAEVNQLSTDIQAKEKENELLASQLSEQKQSAGQVSDEQAKYKSQVEALNEKNEKLTKTLNDERDKLKRLENEKQKLQTAAGDSEELRKLKVELAKIQKELDDEKSSKETKDRLSGGSSFIKFEDLRKVEEDKHRLQKEVTQYQKRVSEMEKRLAELEQSNRETEKAQRKLRHQVDDLNSELEQERAKLKKVDSRQTEVAMGWLKERDEMKKQLTDLQKKNDTMEQEVSDKDKKILEQDVKLLEENRKKDTLQSTIKSKDEDLKHVKDNNNKLKSKLKELEEKFSKVDKNMEDLTEKWRKLDALYKKEKDEWTIKQSDLETELKTEVKRREREEMEQEVRLRDRDEEMIRLREKLRKAEGEAKKSGGHVVSDISIEMIDKIRELEESLGHEKQEYEDLTSKYEELEEEHVVTKSRLVTDKQQVEANLGQVRLEFSQLESELKTVRDTFNMRQDTWIKEKLEMQDKIKSMDNRLTKSDSMAWQKEVDRLNFLVDEKNSIIDRHRKEERNLKEDVEKLRRQNDDLRTKLIEPERSRGPGRGFSSDTTSQKELQEMKNNMMKAEIEELRTKLNQEEKVHRSEVTAVKMMNDVKMAQMQDEIQMLHIQIGKFRRERDTFKEMLDGAQRTITDLKTDTLRRRNTGGNQEVEELKQKLQSVRKALEQQQDLMDSSERSCSQLRTEYMTEKASWEIRLVEMQSKINELEESAILSGGKSRIYGMKTKLELAWQKERDEQQRLLTESHKMAKELRQRVVDMENGRDKERQEGKRQLDELRRTVESDQAETQIKISELQTDLLELRDAHAKMRTTNDRIKREKERLEREREEMRLKLSESLATNADDGSKIAALTDEAEKLMQMYPTVVSATPLKMPKGPDLERMRADFKSTLNKITAMTEELRRSHGVREEERVRRNPSFRRALSATDAEADTTAKPPLTPTRTRKDDPLSRWQNPQRVTNYPASPPSMVISPSRRHPQSTLHRKSLSLDQSLAMEQLEQGIWKSESDAGSSSSLQEAGTAPVHSRSRSSGGEYASSGTTNEPPPSPLPRKKKKGLTSSTTSLESGDSSRGSSVERDLRGSAPVRPPSPSVVPQRHSAVGPGLPPKLGREMTPPVAKKPPLMPGTMPRERPRHLGKSHSIEETPTAEYIAHAGMEALKPGLGASLSSELSELHRQDKDKPKDFKQKISNIFKKPPSRGSSVEGDSGDESSSSSRPRSRGSSRGLLPPVDPKQRVQYRSTGALHSTLSGNESDGSTSDQPSSNTSYTSLPRRLLRKFAIKSKSFDDSTNPPPPAPPRKAPFSETQV